MKIVIEYEPIERVIKISANDFLTFEAFGILEAAKQMITNHWLNEEDK